MTIIDFINLHHGEKVDYDKMYGSQCVDLFRQFCQDVLKIPHTGGVNGAKDLWLNYDNMPKEKEYFIKVDPKEKAQCGDIAIWDKTSGNEFGHVAIVCVDQTDSIVVFEQLGFTTRNMALLNDRSKTNLLGYLRKK